jgi:hypothetical protein
MRGVDEAGASARHERGKGRSHRVDDRPAGGFRGPFIFGVIAATIELAIILALVYW